MLLATRSALAGRWLICSAPMSVPAIDAAIAALAGSATLAKTPPPIEAASKALAQATEAFAAQRMNRGIAQRPVRQEHCQPSEALPIAHAHQNPAPPRILPCRGAEIRRRAGTIHLRGACSTTASTSSTPAT
jgi:hypothetical protein